MTVVFILVALAAVVALTALSSRRRGRRESDGEVSGPRYGSDPAGPEAAIGARTAPPGPAGDQGPETLRAFAGMRALAPGDPLRGRLRETLVLDHMRYAWHIAALYSTPAEPAEVTFATARLGLALAVDAYDPASGLDFLAFATPLILGEVRALRRGARTDPHAPRRSRQLADALPASADRLARQLGRSPTISELAAALGVDIEHVVESLDTALGYRAASAGPSRPSPDHAAGRRVEAPGFAAPLTSEQIKALLAPLSERNKRIVMMRYLRGMTDAQIGAEMNISPVHVSRLLTQAMTVVRTADPSPPSKPGPSPRSNAPGTQNAQSTASSPPATEQDTTPQAPAQRRPPQNLGPSLLTA